MPGAQFITLGEKADPEDLDFINKWKNDANFPLIRAILKNESLEHIRGIIKENTDENVMIFWKKSPKNFIDMPNGDGVTALHAAVIHGNLSITQELLNRGADANVLMNIEGRRYAPLHLAIANAQLNTDVSRFSKILEALLAHPNIQCNARGEWGRTPLHTAIHFQQDWAVEQLLKKDNIDINAATDECDGKKTPLHLCAFTGQLATCKKLLKKGADMFAKDEAGHAPFHSAMFKGGQPQLAKLLLDQVSELSEEQACVVVELMIDVFVQSRKDSESKTSQEIRQLLKMHDVTKAMYPAIENKALAEIQKREQDHRAIHHLEVSSKAFPDVSFPPPIPVPFSAENSKHGKLPNILPPPPISSHLADAKTTAPLPPPPFHPEEPNYANIPPSLLGSSSVLPPPIPSLTGSENLVEDRQSPQSSASSASKPSSLLVEIKAFPATKLRHVSTHKQNSQSSSASAPRQSDIGDWVTDPGFERSSSPPGDVLLTQKEKFDFARELAQRMFSRRRQLREDEDRDDEDTAMKP